MDDGTDSILGKVHFQDNLSFCGILIDWAKKLTRPFLPFHSLIRAELLASSAALLVDVVVSGFDEEGPVGALQLPDGKLLARRQVEQTHLQSS